MGLLFGEVDGNVPWWVGAVVAACTAATTAATTYFLLRSKWRDDRREQGKLDAEERQARTEAENKQRQADATDERKKRRDIIAELTEANDMLRAERDEYREQIHGLRDGLQTVTVELAVCRTQLDGCRADHEEQQRINAAMIDALQEHGIKVIVPGGSRPHRPLPPDGPREGGNQ